MAECALRAQFMIALQQTVTLERESDGLALYTFSWMEARQDHRVHA